MIQVRHGVFLFERKLTSRRSETLSQLSESFDQVQTGLYFFQSLARKVATRSVVARHPASLPDLRFEMFRGRHHDHLAVFSMDVFSVRITVAPTREDKRLAGASILVHRLQEALESECLYHHVIQPGAVSVLQVVPIVRDCSISVVVLESERGKRNVPRPNGAVRSCR